ncbi:MAG: NirA family protein [Oscillatoriaceae cyanobacterium]
MVLGFNSLRRTEEATVAWLMEPHRCPGLFYGTRAQDGYLIRIRTPGGGLNAQQGRAIATLAQRWGSEAIQVTNRANLQIRSVDPTPTPEIFQMLQTLGLAAGDPSIDHLRNVMASPTAGIDPIELIDTRPFVQALDNYLQSHPELASLPAKFSIGIDGGGAVGIGTRSEIKWEHRYNEIQLSAILVEGQKYFQLALGGDKQLQNTQVLIQPDDCVPVVAALAQVYLEYVSGATPAQPKPRMKHLLQDWGMERYLQYVNQHLLSPLRPIADCALPAPTQPYAHLGIHPQRQAGLVYIGIHLKLGQLSATQLHGLVQLSETFGSGSVVLTPWQTLLLPDIPEALVTQVLHHLSSLGWVVSENRVDQAIAACAGKPGCAASATHTQPLAIALGDYLRDQLKLECPVNIHLTGCPKSCAQPSPAEITLLGTTMNYSGENEENYHIYVGNNYLGDVTGAELPLQIGKLLAFYEQHRQTPEESFGEFADRKKLHKNFLHSDK